MHGQFNQELGAIMAVVYWVHLPEHTDIFSQGYVGATTDLAKRTRSHKHKFKDLWDKLVVDTILVAESAYCYLIEKKLRPSRNIGWNKSQGGYRNNVMFGKENPNFKQFGENAPNFKGWYVTPFGEFDDAVKAGEVLGMHQMTVIRKCKGRYVNGRFIQPQQGWAFRQKDRVKS